MSGEGLPKNSRPVKLEVLLADWENRRTYHEHKTDEYYARIMELAFYVHNPRYTVQAYVVGKGHYFYEITPLDDSEVKRSIHRSVGLPEDEP